MAAGFELKPKDNCSWQFATVDNSSGDSQPATFAIRFGGTWIAKTFKIAVDSALSRPATRKRPAAAMEKAEVPEKKAKPTPTLDALKQNGEETTAESLKTAADEAIIEISDSEDDAGVSVVGIHAIHSQLEVTCFHRKC